MSNQDILTILAQWQSRRIRPTDITIQQAADAVRDGTPIVSARAGNSSSRWIFYRKDTSKVAVFTYVGVWAWGSDLETGNFVPPGCTPPEHLPDSRIQNTPSYRCELTYAFDTTVDVVLWDGIKALEDHTVAQTGFNPRGKARRAWQDGLHPQNREKYVVTAKVFGRKAPKSPAPPVPYPIHPWIRDAVLRDSSQIANPQRALYFDSTDGTIRRLQDTESPSFQKNDIVLMTFKLGFIIGTENWWPELMPIELVRVGRLPDQLIGIDNKQLFPDVDEDFVPVQVGTVAQLHDTSTAPQQTTTKPSQQKRKIENTDETQQEHLPPYKRQATDTDSVMTDGTNAGMSREILAPTATAAHDDVPQPQVGLSRVMQDVTNQQAHPGTEHLPSNFSTGGPDHSNDPAISIPAAYTLRSKGKNKENKAPKV